MQYKNNTQHLLFKSMLMACLFAPALLCLSIAHAGLYKGQNAEGNTVYSDIPFHNAKEITPPNITVMDAPKVAAKPKVVEEETTAETKYTKFSILTPKNNETIWNEAQLIVSLQLKPPLDIASGHNIWLIMDGKPRVKHKRSLQLQIGRTDRGSHAIKAQVRNKKGKIIRSTPSITLHIKNTFVPRAAPR